MANLAIDIRLAKNAYDQANLQLDSMITQMNRLIADLANARDTAANLYFEDPSFRVVVSDSQYRANSTMDYAMDQLYRLAKTLEYEWTEALSESDHRPGFLLGTARAGQCAVRPVHAVDGPV